MEDMNKVCVLGLGYIGLPTAAVLASGGLAVVGVDTDKNVIDLIKAGHLQMEEPGLPAFVKEAVGSGRLIVKSTPEEADAFLIAVPTPLSADKKADLQYVIATAKALCPYLRPGNLVILESTCPPRTTVDILVPVLALSGLKPGEDLHVAHCPERVMPGNILHELVHNCRIIGGINEKSSELARELYQRFMRGPIILTDATSAEMVKLTENAYRDVNIALANELVLIAADLGLNALEIIRLANLHPRVGLHRPGPGVGGHCLAVDPWFIAEKSPSAALIRLSRSVNDKMPLYVARRAETLLAGIENPAVTVWGVSYKGNTGDVRESPAIAVIKQLLAQNVTVRVYDPHVKNYDGELSCLEESLNNSDCIVLLADHDEFKYFAPAEIGKLVRHKTLFDTRNCLNPVPWRKAGFTVEVLGGAAPLNPLFACYSFPPQ
jgi:UDP-N-acetyl-D-mannosaminuronic acid dehydrogenase